MTKLATTAFQTNIIDRLAESISDEINNSYYLFAAEHVSRSSNNIPTPVDNTRETCVDAFRKMLFGKRIKADDVKAMVAKNEWTSGSYYDMYDDDDNDLLDNSNFFVVVDEISYLHVYKCLDNNMNAASISQPSFAHITGSNSIVYQTADGYRWKYMYSIAASEHDKFSTASFIPVTSNTSVTGNAVIGAIDVIKIEKSGKNYGNYLTGTFTGSHLRVGGNSVLYELGNSSVSTTNGYYTGCLMYISSGDGAGQYREVSDYFSNSSGSYAVVNNSFATAPQNGSTYEINPKVNITGAGDETSTAVARALVNSLATNSIYRVEMLSRGAGYTYHVANVVANAVVGVTSVAELRPIYGPARGHGYNAAIELGAHHLGIGMYFANTEGNTIPALNSYQKIGILKNPIFANVAFTYYDANGTFTNGEKIYKFNPVRVDTAATINSTSNAVSSNTGDYANQFSVGDWVYLKSSNNASHMLATINSISNATHMTLSSNGKFACTNTVIFKANVSSSAIVSTTTNSTHMVFSNVFGIFGTDDEYVGVSSGARAVVNTVVRNDVIKDFDTYVQMYKYTGSMTSGTFSFDEVVYQGVDLNSSTANARMHSANISGGVVTVYTTEQIGQFATSTSLEGNSSGASATINNKYSPELIECSGEILHLENVQTIDRANNQTESVKILFEFVNS